ncbi:MAG: ABC transporter permease [Planctomycetota bacterium]|nr:ABC transporter permease [Planctomycetota bacterium]
MRPSAVVVAVQAAWAVLKQNAVRSLLTLAVCSLGTAGVIVAGVMGQAQLAEMEVKMQMLGGGLIVVSPNKVPAYPGRARQLEHFISLIPEDGAALQAAVPQLQRVVPVTARTATLRVEQTTSRMRLIGTSPDYFTLRGFQLAKGRFFTPEDVRQRVIVLGDGVARELFPYGVAVGDVAQLNGQPYEVLGLLKRQGVNFAGEDEDHQAFIPIDTYQTRLANRPWLNFLYLQVAPKADSSPVVAAVNSVLRARHGRFQGQVDDIVVRDLADLSAQQSGLQTTALWAVSATSVLLLTVGVIGIATLMLLVVRQRRAEIGLRRALGATPWDICLQFFLEGTSLASLGVAGGLVLGLLVALVVVNFSALPISVDWQLPALAAAVSLGASAAACLLPAISAARLEPAAALRQ